ncbi:hypothetical protein AVEN_224834-1 [Araneus ventricosus]|uniref:Uncharacterized protein n=1 Tax=Araneus ventricosus TaxID=182803 RepID=A0A4Y2N7U9_ARAVE|nr:hypothetical protein AVEN_224834-1 [Araneus ventricosus]
MNLNRAGNYYRKNERRRIQRPYKSNEERLDDHRQPLPRGVCCLADYRKSLNEQINIGQWMDFLQKQGSKGKIKDVDVGKIVGLVI